MIEGSGKGKEKDKAHSRRTFLKRAGAIAVAGAGAALIAKFFSKKEEIPATTQDESKEEQGMKEENIPEVSTPPVENAPSVEKEITVARNLVEMGRLDDFLKSPYLVGALYYSDSFLKELSIARKEKVSESLQVVYGIKDLITPELRKRFMAWLDAQVPEDIDQQARLQKRTSPLSHIDFGQGVGHPDAIDLFIKEGSPVKAIYEGIIVLAESGWEEGNSFGTSSSQCGNGIIVYRPHVSTFYRYCHLEKVSVKVGDHV